MNDLELAKIERRIYSIRGVRVILDADLAVLYGVSTKRLNEQFRRNRRRFPDDFAFANILNSANAVHMSVFVIRAFVKMREHLATNAAILKRLAEIDKSLLVHDSALRDIYQKLLPLLSPTPDPPRRKIGFHPSSK